MNPITASPNTRSSHRRGRAVAEVSMFIGGGSVVGGDFDVHAEVLIVLGSLLGRDILESQDLRCGLEFVDEAADVAVLPRQRHRDRKLAETAVALRFRIELPVEERDV